VPLAGRGRGVRHLPAEAFGFPPLPYWSSASELAGSVSGSPSPVST
jgi:hypothetical protein